MLNTRNKVLVGLLTGSMLFCGGQYVHNLRENSQMYAGLVQSNNEFSDLTSSYYRLEGTVGDVLSDFVIDYKGKTVTSYTIQSEHNALETTPKGLKLINSGEGTATFKYADAVCKIDYVIKPDPNATIVDETPNPEEVAGINTNPQAIYKTCTITANDMPAQGIIMYIDDSKNAFKSTGTFYIEESFLDGKTHTIYIAKFTSRGPVAYAVTQFTSLAHEVNFMNYNESDVDINNLNINLKTDLNNLF